MSDGLEMRLSQLNDQGQKLAGSTETDGPLSPCSSKLASRRPQNSRFAAVTGSGGCSVEQTEVHQVVIGSNAGSDTAAEPQKRSLTMEHSLLIGAENHWCDTVVLP